MAKRRRSFFICIYISDAARGPAILPPPPPPEKKEKRKKENKRRKEKEIKRESQNGEGAKSSAEIDVSAI